jgi:hypothetical protein
VATLVALGRNAAALTPVSAAVHARPAVEGLGGIIALLAA